MSDREKWMSVGVLRSTGAVDLRERQLAKDLAAYQRLRREGLQPPSTEGAAKLEAEGVTAEEINTGMVKRDWPLTERRRMAELMTEAMRPDDA